MVSANERVGLVDAVDHLLNRGAVLAGEATISIAGVDLVYMGLKVLLSSVENLPQGEAGAAARLAAPVAGGPGPYSESGGGAGRGEVSSPRAVAVVPPPVPGIVPEPSDRPEQGLARLVLTLVELLRQVVERQALRRMEGGSLEGEEVERMGRALMELEEKMAELRDAFGLSPEDLDIDLGPLGRLV